MITSAPRTILVSACLLGIKTRYDGECRGKDTVFDFLKKDHWLPIPVCPEQLGGLPTPRPAAEFKTGDGAALLEGNGLLLDQKGDDVSVAFLRGAEQTVELARLCNCSVALLKERSPSCGANSVYCNGKLIEGSGVTAAKLKQIGLQVFSEEDLVEGQLPEQEV